MKIDPKNMYTMPLIMDSWGIRKDTGARVYDRQDVLALQFRTDADAIPRLLPDCYHPSGEPLVTVSFVDYSGVDFMAGRGYRIALMSVKAAFNGLQDHEEGDYILAIFENDTFPILLGRETLGVPKLFADIPPITATPDGHLHCEASLWGHPLFAVDAGPFVKQDDSMVSAANQNPQGPPMLGYKCIPSFDDLPDAAYPTITPSENKLEQLWLGASADLSFGDSTAADIALIASVIDALKTLPIRQVLGASHSFGSSVLRVDLSRRLR
jgi:acetoacetate decarboxylase